ncbi:hypothetical protein RZS08_54520, partial [Arthrospira platensis SPKY1]|nr:hypothetical protein [Arthrospira platensis SPKY1]
STSARTAGSTRMGGKVAERMMFDVLQTCYEGNVSDVGPPQRRKATLSALPRGRQTHHQTARKLPTGAALDGRVPRECRVDRS